MSLRSGSVSMLSDVSLVDCVLVDGDEPPTRRRFAGDLLGDELSLISILRLTIDLVFDFRSDLVFNVVFDSDFGPVFEKLLLSVDRKDRKIKVVCKIW